MGKVRVCRQLVKWVGGVQCEEGGFAICYSIVSSCSAVAFVGGTRDRRRVEMDRIGFGWTELPMQNNKI